MIDNMMEEDTIDKCNDLTYEEAVWIRSFMSFCLFFPIYFICRSLHRLHKVWSFKAKQRNLRKKRENLKRKKANRLEPPSYAELSRDHPTPPSFEDLTPPGLEDLQVDTEPESEPEETLQNENDKKCWGWFGLISGVVLLGLIIKMFTGLGLVLLSLFILL